MTKPENIDLTHTRLELELKNKTYLNEFFMNFISYYIGAKSKINYHMLPSVKDKITIPIYPYEIKESHSNAISLIRSKLEELEDVLSHIEWDKLSKRYQWLAYSIKKLGFSSLEGLKCKVISDSPAINEMFSDVIPIQMNMPTNDDAYVDQIRLNDGSIFTTLVDPYVSDYGIYVDLSIPFDEMGIMPNALHLYEHLSTEAWSDISEKDCSMINGATNAAGLSYVFSIHHTYESFKTFLDATMNFIFKSRNPEFWKSDAMQKALKTETIRTISEIRSGRSHCLMARSDLHAYTDGYDINVFQYWSNKPFNVLCTVTSKNELFATKEKLEKYSKMFPLRKIPRPPNIKYDQIPIEVLITKAAQRYKITKSTVTNNAMHILTKNIEKDTLYGIDCKIHVKDSEEKLEESNSVLHAFLFYNKVVDEKVLNDYCKKNVLPYSNMDYTSNIKAKYSSEWYL